jgi:hypothetical protein
LLLVVGAVTSAGDDEDLPESKLISLLPELCGSEMDGKTVFSGLTPSEEVFCSAAGRTVETSADSSNPTSCELQYIKHLLNMILE